MPTLFIVFGFRFMFYSNDHEPIHVHVIKGDSEARFQVQPEVILLDSKGMKPAELKLAESLVEENKEMIIERWKVMFRELRDENVSSVPHEAVTWSSMVWSL